MTGSNGKTTTVSLLDAMLKVDGKKTFLGGNIGDPLSSFLSGATSADYFVLELSSFQLESLCLVQFDLGLFLNFTSTHEERYKSEKEYFDAKMKLKEISNKFFYGEGLKEKINHPDLLCIQKKVLDPFDLSSWSLKGDHNIENLSAAVKLALELGVKAQSIQKVIDGFNSLDFRVQPLGEINGKAFFNDSKSTNIESTKMAISGFDCSELSLIIGGKVRDELLVDIKSWKKLIMKVNSVVIVGEASELFQKHINLEHVTFVRYFKNISQDLKNYKKNILFSPGFPSFDEFSNYIQRGESFNNFFNDMKQKKQT